MILIDHKATLTEVKQVTRDISALDAVRQAFNKLITTLATSGRTPVQIELTVRVAPK